MSGTFDVSGKEITGEVTPPELYFNRRLWLKGAAAVGSVAATAGIYRYFNPLPHDVGEGEALGVAVDGSLSEAERLSRGFTIDEPKTPFEAIVTYNNFYEFTTDKTAVARKAEGFDTSGWSVEVEGLVENSRTFSIDEIMQLADVEERVYRLRCVEAWSMVVPWNGVPLAALLEAVRPTAEAKYVAMQTLLDPTRMPGQKTAVLDWPYVEGLRLDEARHPLTLLALGLYGKKLPPQDGAPIRLVTPWKYGFKSIKSIVKITLTADQPPTSWSRYAPSEYGFYANVNPAVDHPRWSQATEQRIGEAGRRETLPFNGYANQVASLYEGLDLAVNF